MVDIRPKDLPDAILPLRGTDELIVDQGTDGVRKATASEVINSVSPVASQDDAVAGEDNVKRMTSLRTKQSIASEVGITLASNSQGGKADSAVQSVNGKTGNSISITKADVGLGNVDNTSDIDKPISADTQEALNLKADDSVVVKSVNGVLPVSGNVTVSAEEKRLQNTRESAILEFFESNIKFIETAGYSTVGDGGGGLYTDVNNGNPDSFVTLDGRTWYKVADVQADRVVQSPAYTRMTSRLLSDVLSGQPISPFNFGGNGLAIDQSNALQNALEFTLLDNTNPQSCTLDLVGRNWRTDKGLVIRDVPKTKRRITNGQLTAIGAYADPALLDIRPTANGGSGGSNANWVDALTIDHVNFLGGSSVGATLVQDAIALKNTHSIRIDDCYLQWFNRYGIYDETDREACGVVITNSRIIGTYGNSEGIRLTGADNEIGGKNVISNCKRGITTLMHSVNVENNHIYDCSEASIYYNDTAALCIGNYIDNSPIIIRTPRGTFTGNKFLRALTNPMGEGSAFIVLFPRVPTQFIQGFNFQGNSFANTAGGQVKMFSVDETEGSIGSVYSSIVDGNTVSSATGTVLTQRSRPRGRVQISASNTGTLDLQSQLPFGHIKHAEVTWTKDPVSSVIPAAAITNISASDVVTVGLSQNATGLAYVRGDINEFI